MECLDVSDVIRARSIIGVLASSAKRRILSMLLEAGERGLTAKDIAVRLGVSLPTVLEHMDSLVESGLVEVKREGISVRGSKVYRIKYECVRVNVRLNDYVGVGDTLIEELASRYIAEKRRTSILPSKPNVRDVVKTLGIDRETALMVVAKIASNHEWLVDQLALEALEVLRTSPASIRELAAKLRVDYALAALVASKLIEEGRAVASNGRLVVR